MSGCEIIVTPQCTTAAVVRFYKNKTVIVACFYLQRVSLIGSSEDRVLHSLNGCLLYALTS